LQHAFSAEALHIQEQSMRTKPSQAPANKPPVAPDAETSAAGEEDPGAALDDPVLRDAMQGEAQQAAPAKGRTPRDDEPKTPRK
jgi:hypothetical protein